MPTGPARRAEIDATFSTILPRIVAAQEAYRARFGRYWQGLSSDRPRDKPEGVPADWIEVGFAEVLGFDPSLLAGPVTVDEYTSPRGPGWVIRIRAEFDDGWWVRTWQHGPEAHLEAPWSHDSVSGGP